MTEQEQTRQDKEDRDFADWIAGCDDMTEVYQNRPFLAYQAIKAARKTLVKGGQGRWNLISSVNIAFETRDLADAPTGRVLIVVTGPDGQETVTESGIGV